MDFIAECGFDQFGERALRPPSVVRAKGSPVESVVPCLRSIVEQWLHCGIAYDTPSRLCHDRFKRGTREIGVANEGVHLVNVSPMVFAMMGPQRRRRDQRLKC